MAFIKTAEAKIVGTIDSLSQWENIARNKTKIASDLKVPENIDLNDYLLSHCTIISSVDVEKDVPHYITQDTEKFVNSNCFVSDTEILMSDGTTKIISDIKIGDEVITHKGNIKKVINVHNRDIDENILKIKGWSGKETLVTKEHPFYAAITPTLCTCGCNEEVDKNEIGKASLFRFLRRRYKKGHGIHQRGRKKSKIYPDFQFTEIKEIEKYDLFHYPRVKKIQDIPEITIGKAKLLGYYIAEGYMIRRPKSRGTKKEDWNNMHIESANFALHINEEKTLALDIQKLLKKEFNTESYIQIRTDSNSLVVCSHKNDQLFNFLEKYAGKYSKTKVLHKDILWLPFDKQLAMIKTWFDGDGSFLFQDDKNDVNKITRNFYLRFFVSTASKKLADQLFFLLRRLGFFSYITIAKTCGRKRIDKKVYNDYSKQCIAYGIQVNGAGAIELAKGTFKYKEISNNRIPSQIKCRIFDKHIAFPVVKKEIIHYKGKVYNLEIEDDNSYVANRMSVHNCDAWSREVLLNSYKTFIGGYNFVEHRQIKELNKGFIVDAIARDIGDSVYVDILVATNKKHKKLCSQILSGEYNALSMGTKILYTICSKCGNKAKDETELCGHQKYLKGKHFLDERGKSRIIAELCGSPENLDSNIFFEASWVENPAFKGAVTRNFLNPEKIDKDKITNAYSIMNTRTDVLIADHISGKFASENKKKKEITFDDMDLNDDLVKAKKNFLKILSGMNVNRKKLKLACILYDVDLFNIKSTTELVSKVEKSLNIKLNNSQKKYIIAKANIIKKLNS